MRRYRAPSGKKKLWIWAGFFAIWGGFLSGAGSGLTGSPGILQALRLRGLLQSRLGELSQLEAQIASLQEESTRLESNSAVQEREIRRVLGYAAQDEIIFDFTRGNALRQ